MSMKTKREIICPKCKQIYSVDESRIPDCGTFAQCKVCKERFFIDKNLSDSWIKSSSVENSQVGAIADNVEIKGGIHFHGPALKDDINLDEEIRSYCGNAESLYETIPLSGFRTRLRVPIRLEDIYVPLRAMIDTRCIGGMCFGGAEEAHEYLHGCGEGREISLADAFHEAEKLKRRGIVILGDPGSGKTTHLKRLLLFCLRGGLKELGLPEDMIPVFLPLRELKNLSGGLDDFIQEQFNKDHFRTPEGFGERMRKRGNLLFLLDGLDEVSEAKQREKVSRWLEKALPLYSDCRFVVTCRFAGYTDRVQLDAGFLEMHVQPLDAQEAEQFIHNWYLIVETGILPDKKQAEIIADVEAKKLIERLKQPEFRARRVFELTRNPLLLTNLCLVHRDRGNLPKNRTRLYEECTDVLLELWRDSIGFERRLDAQTGRRVLQPAALWLHQEDGRTRASADELSPVIGPALKAAKWKHGTPADFLKAVRDESGLLTGWDQENYGFMHLGFQEYLAAREIRIQAYKNPAILRELAAHFGESWWQEVILILLALEEPSHFENFMAEVVRLPAFTENRNLVEMCLDDAAEISDRPFVELLESPPIDDREFWERQLAALEIVKRLDGSLPEILDEKLQDHPYDKIRKRFRAFSQQKTQDVMYAERGGYELIRIPAGSFMMGSSEYDDEKPVHEVHLSEFYMGRYPVTNEEYSRFLIENPDVSEPQYWGDRRFNQSRQPVVGVSWHNAQTYAKWAGLHMPTEAQWEYACRAGSHTQYYTGDKETDLDQTGWYIKNSDGKLHLIGEKTPNIFGLYDMHGNVWEWCQDWYDNYLSGIVTDPVGPENGSYRVYDGGYRVIRGGSWRNAAQVCRSALRYGSIPSAKDSDLGFRLVFLPNHK